MSAVGPMPAPGRAVTRTALRRLAVLSLAFAVAMGAVAYRFGELAAKHDPDFEPDRRTVAAPRQKLKERVEIADRHGAPLAIGVRAYALSYEPPKSLFPDEAAEAAERLAAALPGLDEASLARRFALGRHTLVKRPATPDEVQTAHDLGLPGLYFTPRIERVTVGGRAFSHLLGSVNVDGRGVSGVEGALEHRLEARSAPGAPLRLTVDARAQRQTRAALAEAVAATGAQAGAAVILDADSGAVRALVSLPDFDPARAPVRGSSDGADNALFSRAVAGRYELGSTFKIFTWALALEAGAARPDESFGRPEPLPVGRFTVSDPYPIPGEVTFARGFAKSSNIVAAQLALRVGRERQQAFFRSLGLAEPTGVELVEAQGVKPLWSAHWGRTTTATAAYGHGIAATPLHLAAAVATVVNGGWRVRPTLLEPGPEALTRRPRALSADTSHALRGLMRLAVTDGTGRAADVPGLHVGGKTGTADKPDPSGGYYEDRVIAAFAAAYPIQDPRYVVVVMLDEAEDAEGRRGASRTAAPAAAAIIARTAPLLGVAPRREAPASEGVETSETPEAPSAD